MIFGLVRVLFVNVSVPVNETKLSPCNPALNSANVPVNVPKSSKSMCSVFALLLIVLLVNVSEDVSVTIEPSVDNVILLFVIAVVIPDPPIISKLPPKSTLKFVEESSPIVIDELLNIVFDTEPVSPVPTKVPDAVGKTNTAELAAECGAACSVCAWALELSQ